MGRLAIVSLVRLFGGMVGRCVSRLVCGRVLHMFGQSNCRLYGVWAGWTVDVVGRTVGWCISCFFGGLVGWWVACVGQAVGELSGRSVDWWSCFGSVWLIGLLVGQSVAWMMSWLVFWLTS